MSTYSDRRHFDTSKTASFRHIQNRRRFENPKLRHVDILKLRHFDRSIAALWRCGVEKPLYFLPIQCQQYPAPTVPTANGTAGNDALPTKYNSLKMTLQSRDNCHTVLLTPRTAARRTSAAILDSC
jgi:hypothetical protein